MSNYWVRDTLEWTCDLGLKNLVLYKHVSLHGHIIELESYLHN